MIFKIVKLLTRNNNLSQFFILHVVNGIDDISLKISNNDLENILDDIHLKKLLKMKKEYVFYIVNDNRNF